MIREKIFFRNSTKDKRIDINNPSGTQRDTASKHIASTACNDTKGFMTPSLHPLTLSRQDLAYHDLIKRRHKIDSKKKKKRACVDRWLLSIWFLFSLLLCRVGRHSIKRLTFASLDSHLRLRDSRSNLALVWLRTAFSLGSLSSFYASKISLLERSRDEIRVDDNQSGDKYLNCCDKYLNRLRAPALETRIARIWTYTSSLFFFFFFVVSIYLFERSEWMVIIKSGDI